MSRFPLSSHTRTAFPFPAQPEGRVILQNLHTPVMTLFLVLTRGTESCLCVVSGEKEWDERAGGEARDRRESGFRSHDDEQEERLVNSLTNACKHF